MEGGLHEHEKGHVNFKKKRGTFLRGNTTSRRPFLPFMYSGVGSYYYYYSSRPFFGSKKFYTVSIHREIPIRLSRTYP
jgi:hypothetical protein